MTTEQTPPRRPIRARESATEGVLESRQPPS
jgi:hypothetical protein